MKALLEKYKPSVNRKILPVIAGAVWVLVGSMLITYSYDWLINYEGRYVWIFVVAGIIIAVFIHLFGFSKIVQKNIDRISDMSGKRCVFSFITWNSYVLIIIMVSLGLALRHSPIPKEYLSIVYTAIGTALILSGMKYFKSEKKSKYA